MEMDAATRHKLDDVLAQVKEPVTELSLAELNLVSKITYSAKQKILVVHLEGSSGRRECPARAAMNSAVLAGIERTLTEELQKVFPGFSVEFE